MHPKGYWVWICGADVIDDGGYSDAGALGSNLCRDRSNNVEKEPAAIL